MFTAVGISLSSDNFYPPEGVLSAYLVSQAVLIRCCLVVGKQRKHLLLLLPLT